MAHLVHALGGLLEHAWSGDIWLPHQSSHRALLHAGPEHDGTPWSHGPLWCVWHVGDRADAVRGQRPRGAWAVEGKPHGFLILVDQSRSAADGAPQSAAGGPHADRREREPWPVVRSKRGV